MKKAIKEKNIDGDKKNSKGNKKKKFKKAVILFVIIGIAVIGMLFTKVIIPAQNATKKYNIAVKEYNNEAEKYNEAAEKASLDNIDGLPAKADTLGSVSESYFAVIKSLLNGNSKAKIKKDISKLEEMLKMLAENAKVAEQVTVPEEVWLINRLQSVDGIKDIVPVTKDNDPNGMLNKEDGYVSCVYFSYDKVDNSSVPGENVIDKGTDCGGAVEIYGTLQAAQNRVSYLAGFDNTILYSGSYAIVGTMVIRTSYLLTDEEQYNLTDAITRAVTKIE